MNHGNSTDSISHLTLLSTVTFETVLVVLIIAFICGSLAKTLQYRNCLSSHIYSDSFSSMSQMFAAVICKNVTSTWWVNYYNNCSSTYECKYNNSSHIISPTVLWLDRELRNRTASSWLCYFWLSIYVHMYTQHIYPVARVVL